MGFKLEMAKAWLRFIFLIGLMLTIYALVTEGDQPIETMIGAVLSTLGVMFGWFDFEKAFQ